MVELPLNRALMEPALSLQPPPTNVTVGPPKNSLEVTMLDVSTSQLPIIESNPPPVIESSFNPSTSGILSAIQGMITKAIRPLASQISVVSTRCDTIQSQQAVSAVDKPYSPSAPAALWAPNPTNWDRPEITQQNSLPSYLDQPRIDYNTDMGDYNYTPHIHPDLLPVAQDVDQFYRCLYNVHPDSTLLVSQDAELRQFEDDVESYRMEWLSSDSGPLPWSDRIEYNFKQWRATVLQAQAFQAEDLQSKGATSKAHNTFIPPSLGPQPGSIKLFPDRPPSAPPITTINKPPKHQPTTNLGWSIMGKSGKPKSFAAAATQPAKPANNAGKPTTQTSGPTTAIPGQPICTLTCAQLTSLSNQEIINAFKIRFRSRVHSRTAGKEALIGMYLCTAKKNLHTDQVVLVGQADTYVANRDNKTTRRPRPQPTPVVTTDYTITRSPSARSIQGPKGDPAAIVCSLQTAIRQAYGNNNPPITLLSGRWSSQLSSNFILTFSGTPSNDNILKFSSTLCSPFGLGSSIVPQRGFTQVIVHSVPIVYSNGVRPESKALSAELARNEACTGLCIIQQPKWLRSTLTAEQTQSSILFAFLDKDGSRLQHLTSRPVFLYGAPCIVKLFNSLPLIRQCDRCHALGHDVKNCRRPKNSIICPLCAGHHLAKDHGFKCVNAKAHHTSLSCTCPPTCINCKAKGLKSVGHVTRDLSCPLRKLFRCMDNRMGNLSEEDTSRPMIVDPVYNSTNTIVPSSQPDEDDQVIFAPEPQASTPSAKDRSDFYLTGGTALRGPRPVPSVPTRVDDTGSATAATTSKQACNIAQAWAVAADVQFWTDFSSDDFNRLSLKELLELPPLGLMQAYQLDINIDSLRSALTNV